LLVSIYLIETKCRPLFIRLGEYSLLIISIALNLIIKRPVKNYTIGTCQLGVACIINFYGEHLYHHIEYIPKIDFYKAYKIFKSTLCEEHFEVLVYRIKPILERAVRIYPSYKTENILCYVGEQFNGRYAYGIMLSEIVYSLDLADRSHSAISVS